MNYISLGYFCSVAIDLEKLGLRESSSPFDWVISDFEGVMLAIQERCVDFLEYKYLFQNKELPHIYKNTKYNFDFYHDFSKYKSLKKQLPIICKKYNRRIDRFFNTITTPTCFIRYISDEKTIDGKSSELVYIENNYDNILGIIKEFNKENEIIFIANEGVTSDKIPIYNVQKDENDIVARSPFYKSPVLFDKFSNIDIPNKQANIDRYLQKEKARNSIVNRLKRKIVSAFNRFFLNENFHENQY